MKPNFSLAIKSVVSLSRNEALRLNNEHIGIEHLFLALVDEGSVNKMLEEFGVNLKELQENIISAIRKDSPAQNIVPEEMTFSQPAELILKIAAVEAKYARSKDVGPKHLMLAILRDDENEARKLLLKYNINYDVMRQKVYEVKSYSQLRAMLAITRASLQSIFRNPSTVAFSFAFPLFFIIVFGFVGNRNIKVSVGIVPGSDTTSQIYAMMNSRPEVKLVTSETKEQMIEELEKGKLDGVLAIQKNSDSSATPFVLSLQTSKASAEGGAVIQMFMMHSVDAANLAAMPAAKHVAELHSSEVSNRAFKSIDFILPGMLGFSLLSMGVFGTAFVFLNLRNTLVIKRFFATPIQRMYIVLGEALSRVLFALLSSSFIIILGRFAFGFTLVHGLVTFVNMLVLTFIALFVFMGFGFIISGVAKTESAVPPLANLVTLPQFLLGGTFFPITAFPSWLQPVPKIMPLTYLNDAMRKVAFEGASLFQVWNDLLVLGIWGVVIYFFATRLFKWE
jgi:ABC-2 type transport system permease protein